MEDPVLQLRKKSPLTEHAMNNKLFIFFLSLSTLIFTNVATAGATNLSECLQDGYALSAGDIAFIKKNINENKPVTVVDNKLQYKTMFSPPASSNTCPQVNKEKLMTTDFISCTCPSYCTPTHPCIIICGDGDSRHKIRCP